MIYLPSLIKGHISSIFFLPPELLTVDIDLAKNSTNIITVYIDVVAGTDTYSEILKTRIKNKLPTNIILDFSRESFGSYMYDVFSNAIPEINLISNKLIIHNICDLRCYTPIPENYKTLAIDYYMLETYYNCILKDHPYNIEPVASRNNGLNLLIGKLKTKFGRFLTSYYFYKHDLLETAVLGLNAYSEDIENMMKVHPEYLDYNYFNKIKNYLGPADHTDIVETDEGITSGTGWPFDHNIFKNSSVSYICETYDIDKGRYPYLMTEKFYRSIVNRHPFVIQSSPGQLDLVKTVGFKTFSDIIVEDYNTYDTFNFEHVEKTVLAGKDLVQKIPSNIALVQEIVDFNFNHFEKLSKNALVQFRSKILKFINKKG